MDITGKTFIVSGGASGLGAGVVRKLSGLGANVVIADINTESGEKMATDLGEIGRFVKTDVTSEENVQAAVNFAADTFGALHGAISCAGIAPGERTLSKKGVHRLATFTKTIEINLIGTFNMIRLSAEVMARNEPLNESGERGVIINTASVAAYEGQIGQAAYSASKGGIVGMTLPIARDLASLGIRVVSTAPGIFDTPLLAGMPDDVRTSLAAAVPFPSRLGTPEDFSFLIQHIIENDMINGETIRLDGAIRLAPR